MYDSRFRLVAATGLVFLAALAGAEVNYKTLNFKTTIGSFKILGTDVPASGTVSFSFRGTVLVSGLEGTVVPTGSVRLEYADKPHRKQVFHGAGSLTVNGKFTGIQFFGNDLVGKFIGFGLIRMYGEFDRNLNTGEFWYEGGEHTDWGTGGRMQTVPGLPPSADLFRPRPKVKISKG